ncbi:MAG: DUF6249 domain-containing protein [Candidatus Acidiferrales bacterium]
MNVALVAVTLSLAVPLAMIYVYYRVQKLRTEERLAAIAKGISVPQKEELQPHARSRRAGILLVAGGLGYALTFWAVGHAEPDAYTAAAFGILPVALGIGYFIDATLIRRELRASH